MQPAFQVEVADFQDIREIPGARSTADLVALVDADDLGDVDGLSDAEVREMCVMVLQDLGAVEAAVLVLTNDLAGALTKGQIRNLAEEYDGEKHWEHYADLTLHERLFVSYSLLWQAFPEAFPEPDAACVTLNVVAENDAARALLGPEPSEAFIVRLLADGMDSRAILRRLFDDQLAGTSFPEAPAIAWIVQVEPVADGRATVRVTSSGYWLDPLRRAGSYPSTADADAPDGDED